MEVGKEKERGLRGTGRERRASSRVTIAAVGSGSFFPGGADEVSLLEGRKRYSHDRPFLVQFAHVGLDSSHCGECQYPNRCRGSYL